MTESVKLTVTGMKCGGCENNVTTKLLALAGVISAKASHQTKQVDVVYDPLQIHLDEIEDTISGAGFTVE